MIPDPILDPIYLKNNWADNGEKAVSLFTWDKAVSIFRMIEKIFNQERYIEIETPSFSPTPNGSIDIIGMLKVNIHYSLTLIGIL